MSKITQSARGEDCTIRLPGGPCDPETVVFAHAPSVDKGIGFKSPDWWGAYCCHRCHDILDGRDPRSHVMTMAPYWMRGIYRTLKLLIHKGLIQT